MKAQPPQNPGRVEPGDEARVAAGGVKLGRGAWSWAGAMAIVLIGAYAFAPALSGGWVWDDDSEIVHNGVIKDPAGVAKIWRGIGTLDYFPLKTTLQWIQWRWWGDNPAPYHATNVVLHLLSALLVWRLMRKLGCAPVAAWAAGLLFAVHPLTVESVAWIAEFKNAVSLPPLLLATILFVDYVESGRWRDLALAWLCFLGAGLCKSTVVMLPPVLLLFWWWRRGRVTRHAALAVAPFFAVSAALGSVTVWFQHERAMAAWAIVAGGAFERIGRAGAALVFYLGKSIAPVGLLPVYPRDVPPDSLLLTVCAWMGLLAVPAWCWRRRQEWGRHALLAFGWFGLHLLPVVGLVAMAFMHFAWVADHFAYISLVGVVGAGAAAGQEVWDRAGRGRIAFAAAIVLAVAGAVIGTRQHASRFQSEESLWRYTLEHNPGAAVAHNNLATVFLRRKQFAEALTHTAAALRLDPGYDDALVNQATALLNLERIDDAIAMHAPAGRSAELQANMAAALLRAQRVDEAIQYYEVALAADPESGPANKGIGVALFLKGRVNEAVAHYERGLRVSPDAATHTNCGVALAALNRLPDAVRHYEAALRLDPLSADAHYNLGIALARLGSLADAQRQFEETIHLSPGHAEAYFNLGDVLLRRGSTAEAANAWRTALRVRPELGEARARLEQLERGAPR